MLFRSSSTNLYQLLHVGRLECSMGSVPSILPHSEGLLTLPGLHVAPALGMLFVQLGTVGR